MLLDNKTPRGNDPRTVYEFFRDGLTQSGTFDVVTGYFSAAALSQVYLDFNEHLKACRLVIGDRAQVEQEGDKRYDLFSGDLGLNQGLQLSTNAKNAIAFLEQDKVQARTLQPNFCHAKAYLFEAGSKQSKHHFYVTGSSNLTHAGLGLTESGNLELNTAASGQDSEYANLREWYQALWDKPQTRARVSVPNANGTPHEVDFKQHLLAMLRDLSKIYSPRQLYEKVLFELFYDELKAWESRPDAQHVLHDLRGSVVYRTLLPFQQQGVLSLIRMLQTYGGAILADAVGLGKTWQALAVMKFFQDQGREVILCCPKKLEHNWRRYKKDQFSRFEDDGLEFVVRYHTDLTPELIEHNGPGKPEQKPLQYFQSRKPKLLVIDESHNLRNDKGSRYQFLAQEILEKNRDIKVLLLSATPINTGLLDVRNQFKLLVQGRDDGFRAVPDIQINSLRHAFADVQHRFDEWQQQPAETRQLAEFLQHLPKPFFDLTDRLIVARTRKMILGQATGLHFPRKLPPQNLYVGLDRLGGLHSFKAIFAAFRVNMTAYRPAEYVKAEKPKAGEAVAFGDEVAREQFLVRMMMVLLVKRLESCWWSFGSTVKRILDHHENALRKLDAFEATGADAALTDADTAAAASSDAEADEFADVVPEGTDAADLTLGKKRPVRLADLLRREAFRRDLEKDLAKLRPLYGHVQKMTATVAAETAATPLPDLADTKLARLISEIQAKRAPRPDGTVPNQKVIIFTVFHDTAEYLYRELMRRGFGRVAMVSGQGGRADDGYASPQFEPLLERFAPFTKLYNERDWTASYRAWGLLPVDADGKEGVFKPSFEEWKALLRWHRHKAAAQLDAPLDLLIATDCLSEGQNLQDADCVINYDIHWNPVRLIQRMGRVDRLGSPNATVTGYNFWPAQDYDDYLKLKTRVENRMALLAVVGAEYDDELSPAMKKLVEGLDKTPMATQQAERMLRQMQTTWDDLETPPDQLSFDDFSLEPFRQQLLALLSRDHDRYRRLPPGIFTGFQTLTAPNGQPYPAPGVVALLGYPRRPERAAPDWRYQEKLLAYAAPGGPVRFANTAAVLKALDRHADQPRYVPELVDAGENGALQALRDELDAWLAHQRAPTQAAAVVKGLLTGKVKLAPAPTAATAALPAPVASPGEQVQVEQKFQPDQFDLICWFAVTPGA